MNSLIRFSGIAALACLLPWTEILAESPDKPFPDTPFPDKPLLTVKQLMNVLITPTTASIWGASDLKTDAQWQAVEHAALGVIATGNLLASGGAGEGEAALAGEADWQTYNNQMIDAARQVIDAVEARDEDKLFEVGNNALYPPCEACHQKYQKR